VAIAIVAAFVGGVLLVLHLLRLRCPACRKPTLEVDLRDRSDGRIPGAPSAYRFRCQTCGEEFRRQDGGPMIAKAAWEAGAREELPRARVHR
jgi:transposase-like protein